MGDTVERKFYQTRGIAAATENSQEMLLDVMKAVEQFNKGDWGVLEKEDIEANDQDLKNRDGHVLGKYETAKGNIYIDLEFDDSEPQKKDNCVIMFCEEY